MLVPQQRPTLPFVAEVPVNPFDLLSVPIQQFHTTSEAFSSAPLGYLPVPLQPQSVTPQQLQELPIPIQQDDASLTPQAPINAEELYDGALAALIPLFQSPSNSSADFSPDSAPFDLTYQYQQSDSAGVDIGTIDADVGLVDIGTELGIHPTTEPHCILW